MGIFDYKHDKKIEFKKVSNTGFLEEDTPSIIIPEETVKETTNVISDQNELINLIKSEFNNKSIALNPLFDNELLSDLEVFQDFLNTFIPGISKYTTGDNNGTKTVNLSSLVDARDYLINEFGFSPDEVLDNNLDAKQLYYSDFNIKENGKIYKNGEVIFDPSEPCENFITQIDFEKMLVTIAPGIIIPFAYLLNYNNNPTNFTDDSFNTDAEVLTIDPYDNPFFNNLIKDNALVTNKDLVTLNFSNGDLTTDTLFKSVGVNNYGDLLKNFILNPTINSDNSTADSITVCKLKDINFLYLLLLLILGGGEEGVAPLSTTAQQTISFSASGCSGGTWNVYHPLMYTTAKQQGVKKSILQFIEPLTNAVKSWNIPKLQFTILGYDIKVFPGLCILGYLERMVIEAQAKISAEIRKAFTCTITYYKPTVNSSGAGIDLSTGTTTSYSSNNSNTAFNTAVSNNDETIQRNGSAVDAIASVITSGTYNKTVPTTVTTSENVVDFVVDDPVVYKAGTTEIVTSTTPKFGG